MSWTRCDNSASGAYWMWIFPQYDYVVFVLDPSHKVLVASMLALKAGGAGLDVSDRRNWTMLLPQVQRSLAEAMEDFTRQFADGSIT